MNSFHDISQALQWLGAAGTASIILIALTAAATLSTAMISLVKDLTTFRRWFQELWLGRWLRRRADAFELDRAKDSTLPKIDIEKVKSQLIGLATGGDKAAFYDLSSDQLVAQTNAAAQSALDYPGTDFYYPLLAVLSQGASIADLKSIVPIASFRTLPGPLTADQSNARTRVANRMQRNLDGMQISLGNKWQFVLQTAAFITSTAVIEFALVESGHPATSDNIGAYFLALPIGFVASYMSPVINDLVKGLQSLNK